MPANFPINPTLNQTYTFSGSTWTWDGSTWLLTSTAQVTGATGATGAGVTLTAVASHVIPAANVTYDLGTGSQRWRDLYLSGNTIDLGGTAIKSSANGVSFTSAANAAATVPLTVSSIQLSSGGNVITLQASASGLQTVGSSGNAVPISGGGKFTYSNAAPSSPTAGDRWLDTETLKEFVFADLGATGIWIEPAGDGGFVGATGPTGATGITGATGPAGAGANAYDQPTTSKGYISIPFGNTAQRPASPPEGAMRVNITTSNKVLEIYNLESNAWVSLNTIQNYGFSIEYLVVAGGGGGGSGHGGGGGAGGFRTNVTGATSGGGSAAESAKYVLANTNCTVTVGAGGGGANPGSPQRAGSTGSNSVFDNITSLGGGGGGGGVAPNMAGLAGGSSGGVAGQSGGSLAATPGTVGQGYAGGKGNAGGDGGGGGGAGGNAPDAGNNSGLGPRGGFGANSSITGTAVTYAGGGGGGGGYNTGTPTGIGQAGGGNGGVGAGGPGLPATANSGSGGGGGGWNEALGANGGSGLVIIKYTSSATMTNPGGGLTFSTATSGGFKITTFTAGTGTVTFS